MKHEDLRGLIDDLWTGALILMVIVLLLHSAGCGGGGGAKETTEDKKHSARKDIDLKFRVEPTSKTPDAGARGRVKANGVEFDIPPGAVAMGELSSSAREEEAVFTESQVKAAKQRIVTLWIIGGLMVAAGVVVAVWCAKPGLGISVALGGLALIGVMILAESYAWLLVVLVLVAAGIGVWWILDTRQANKAWAALKGIAKRIETAPAHVSEPVKAELKKATGAEKEAITDASRKARKEEGLI